MEKSTQKLIKKYSLTDEMLQNETIKIEMDVSGYKGYITEHADALNIEMEASPTKQLTGREVFSLIGNAASILSLLDMVKGQLGPSAQVGVLVFTVGSVVLMTVVEARELILKQISEKKREEHNTQ